MGLRIGLVGRGTSLEVGGVASLTLLCMSLGKELSVGGSLLTRSIRARLLEGGLVALALKHLGGDETLDLGSLGVTLALALLNLAADDVLANIVVLCQVKELADLAGTLGSEAAWSGSV